MLLRILSCFLFLRVLYMGCLMPAFVGHYRWLAFMNLIFLLIESRHCAVFVAHRRRTRILERGFYCEEVLQPCATDGPGKLPRLPQWPIMLKDAILQRMWVTVEGSCFFKLVFPLCVHRSFPNLVLFLRLCWQFSFFQSTPVLFILLFLLLVLLLYPYSLPFFHASGIGPSHSLLVSRSPLPSHLR